MMMQPKFRYLGVRRVLDLLCKLVTLMFVVGLPFWWFLVQLAEHGLK